MVLGWAFVIVGCMSGNPSADATCNATALNLPVGAIVYNSELDCQLTAAAAFEISGVLVTCTPYIMKGIS